uniref:GPI ethanolamine phosphate transferase 3 n=1 Tax=Steinernema glaseri TaxID=37863 RepID=A0A1I8AAN5_9BILA
MSANYSFPDLLTSAGIPMFGRYLLLSVGYILSLLVFQAGFLLKRHELPYFSSCGDVVASSSCWIEPSFKRAVWIVVDALRYDFVDPEAKGGSSFYQHQMPNVERLIRSEPEKALLARFIADPPTTTLQRLKGLTAGSLPTFIDAGANFAATSIGEDNVIDQLRSTGRNVSFLGDDTWESLYPKQFHRSSALPSFDITDLHTVDDMILKSLYGELNRTDWQLLIAHFLGVDHCGHKYGPDHPEMRVKLHQMDNVIAEVAAKIDDDTILFVMGDHGMTVTGDHGGDSEPETNAAFFAYAKRKIVWSQRRRTSVYQVDFVPTLSLLLDFPIPFSNVGRLMEEFFVSSKLVKASKANCWQMVRFVQSYIEKQPHLKPHVDWILRDFENGQENDVERNALVMRRLQEVLREAWTSFDMALMRVGLISFAECLIFHLYLSVNRSNQITVASVVIRTGVALLQLAVILGNKEEFIINALDMTLVSSAAFYAVVLLFSWNLAFTVPLVSAVGCTLFHAVSMTSNSFVVYEPRVLQFFIQSLLMLCAFEDMIWNRQKTRKHLNSLSDLAKVLTSGSSLKWILLCAVVTRCSSVFERCREEQVNCETTFFTGSLSAVFDDVEKRVRVTIGVLSLLAMNIGLHRLRDPKKDSAMAQLSSASSWASVGAVSLHWILQLLPDAVLQRFQSFSLGCAQFVYVVGLLNCVYAIQSSKEVRATLVGILQALAPSLTIILGDGAALPLLALLVVPVVISSLIPNSVFRFMLVYFIGLYGFSALGHQPTLSAIPWQAAFVGIPGNFAFQALPALIVLLHIFSSHFVVALTMPLTMPSGTEEWIAGFLFINAVKSFAVAGTAFLQRRHLMVWKIFAPKFIYDAISLIFIAVTSSLVLVLLRLKARH